MAVVTAPPGAAARGEAEALVPRGRRWSLRAARLGLLLLGVLTPLLLLEVVLRLAGPILPGDYQTASFTAPSPLIGRQNRPNTAGWRRTNEFTTWVRVNSHGLRGPEIEYAKVPGSYRVLLLGDSFTFAMQVDEEDTLVARLAKRVNRSQSSVQVETLNAGTDGWGTVNEYAWLTAEGYRFQPDLVLLMFYVGNDPGENADQIGTPEQLDQLRFGVERVPLLTVREKLSSVSVAYNVFEQGVIAKLSPPPAPEADDDDRETRAGRRADAERKERGWAISEALITRMRDFSAEHGASLIVVGIPTAGQVLDSDPAGGQLREIGERTGVPTIDLLEPFRAQPRALREQLYFQRNKHWTPEGHSLASQVIARELARLGLLGG